MNPAKFDLSMYRGDSYSWRFIFWEDDAKTIPVVLTGAQVKLEIRDKPAGTTILPIPCTITTPNIVDIAMTPAMYATCPSKGVWDLQITFADGQVQTPIGGSVSVTQDVTDSVALNTRAKV